MNYYFKLVMLPLGSSMVSVAAVLPTTESWKPVAAAALAAYGSTLLAYLKTPPTKGANEPNYEGPHT